MVKKAEMKIEEILQENLNVVEKALDVYTEYMFILSESPKLDAYLEDPKPKSIDDYWHKIGFYIDTIEKIRQNLPFEIRMNMIMIDC